MSDHYAKAIIRDLLEHMRRSDEPMVSDLLYRSPVDQLRHQARRLEDRDRAIQHARDYLAGIIPEGQ